MMLGNLIALFIFLALREALAEVYPRKQRQLQMPLQQAVVGI